MRRNSDNDPKFRKFSLKNILSVNIVQPLKNFYQKYFPVHLRTFSNDLIHFRFHDVLHEPPQTIFQKNACLKRNNVQMEEQKKLHCFNS